MCATALVYARVKRVVFATRDFRIGAGGSQFNLFKWFTFKSHGMR